MRPALVIAAKDLRQRIRDKSAILLGVVAPLGLAFIFSQVLPDVEGADLLIPLGVVDLDGGPVAAHLVDELLPSIESEGVVVIEELPSEEQGRTAVENGAVDAAIVIPDGFTEAVSAPPSADCAPSEPCPAATLTVIGHIDRGIARDIAAGITSSYAARLTTARVAAGAATMVGGDPEAAARAASEQPPAVGVADVTAASRQLDAATYISAGMAVFFLFFTVQFGVLSLLEERVNGTLPRLLAAPIRWWHVVAGKALASFATGVISMTVLIAGSAVLIGATWGNPLGVALLVVTGVLAAIGIMAVIATVARTSEQAANAQAVVAVVLGMLGGTFFPVSQGPEVLANLAYLTPHAWFLRGLADLADGAGAAAAIPAALAMTGFFLVTAAIASLRLRRMVQP